MIQLRREKRSSFADVDARFARAEAEGYIHGAYHEQDSVLYLSKHNDKPKKGHDRVLTQYVQCARRSCFGVGQATVLLTRPQVEAQSREAISSSECGTSNLPQRPTTSPCYGPSPRYASRSFEQSVEMVSPMSQSAGQLSRASWLRSQIRHILAPSPSMLSARDLGHEVDSGSRTLGKIPLTNNSEKYTAVQRSQHLTRANIRIFGASHMAHISSVNGQGAVLREPVRHDHIAFFQSFERFQISLATKLLLEKKEA